jgi:hypothetical protein
VECVGSDIRPGKGERMEGGITVWLGVDTWLGFAYDALLRGMPLPDVWTSLSHYDLERGVVGLVDSHSICLENEYMVTMRWELAIDLDCGTNWRGLHG